MSQNIRRDYLWNSVGVFAQNLISPLLLLVVTRINGIEASGVFSFAFAISVIIWAIAMWGGRTYQVSDVKNEFSYTAYLMARYILALISVVIALLFVLVNNYDLNKSSIIITLVIFKAVESIADGVYGVMQRNNKLYISGISLTIKAVIGFVAFVAIDLLTHNLAWSVIAVICVNAVTVLCFDAYHVRGYVSLSSPFRNIRKSGVLAIKILKRSWAAFAVLIASMFSLNIPRYFLDIYHPDQIGYYGIIAMPVTLIVLMMSFILQPRVVEISHLLTENRMHLLRKRIVGIFGVTVTVGVVTLVGTYLFGVWIMSLVFGVNFSEYQNSLIIIVLGAILNALVAIFVNILTIMRKFVVQLSILILTNITLAVVSTFIINTYGTIGAVSLFAITSSVQFVLLAIYCHKQLRGDV